MSALARTVPRRGLALGLAALFAGLLAVAVPSVVAGAVAPAGAVEPAVAAGDPVPEGELTTTRIYGDLFGHLTPHAIASFDVGLPFPITIYNINTVQWISGTVLLLVMLWVAGRAKALQAGAPRGGVYGLFESVILFVRDEMVYAVIGKELGRALVPFFLTQFFFILFMNLFGLLPDIGHTGLMGTATANLAVTCGLALTSFVAIHVLGMAQFGFFKHWKNFVPHVPWWLVPLIAVVEVVGILVKPAALMVRLFANLTAGHLIVLGLFGLAYSTSMAIGGLMGNVAGYLPILLAIAIYGLELFVCFVQAYIFTYLTIVFVGASLHPEH